MKTQTPNTQLQGVLRYREVLQCHDVLLNEQKRTRRQINNLIQMAKRCSKSTNLGGEKRGKLKDIVATWQKFL